MNLEDAIIKNNLPEESSRQVVKKELFKRSFENISGKFSNSRKERRELARRISKDLFRQGERLKSS